MADTVPAAFFAQWSALQEENRQLQQKVNDLTNEKMDWLEERVTLQNKYDNLKKEHDELVEEHRDCVEEMTSINTRLKAELEAAQSDLVTLREAFAKEEEAVGELKAAKSLEEARTCLIEKFYNYASAEFNLCALWNYCAAYRFAWERFQDLLSLDNRCAFKATADLKNRIVGGKEREFFENVLAFLPGLESITGDPIYIPKSYVWHKKSGLPLRVVEACCKGFGASCRGKCFFEQSEFDVLESEGVDMDEYLSLLMPHLTVADTVDVGGTSLKSLEWCSAVPSTVSVLRIAGCRRLANCAPLLKMKGLKELQYDRGTNSSIKAVKSELVKKGVVMVNADKR
ncbi:hypothetical protein ADEAN_000194200 [Angomonas deanei]|uniref:Uncharacterized protein n=1 Tax=Angomonas deanei TaxID=59799 RepID=A0A7G2C4S0_9TRYP|nr:hypothetical protein ADEAN_000194200 [Angomonas deanei]